MNKWFKGVLGLLLCAGTMSFASENEKPFFDQPTQDVYRRFGKDYVQFYSLCWVVENCLSIAVLTTRSPFVWPTVSEIKKANWETVKKYAKSTTVTAPIFFGSVIAWHKYKEHQLVNAQKIAE